MMNVILVDDEIASLEELAYNLNRIDDKVNILGKYQDPREALERIRANPPDAVFLDIEMRVIDGFTLASEILGMKNQIAIVFATAFDEYAVKAFEMNAVDYVLKPFVRERLAITLDRIMERRKEVSKRAGNVLNSFIQEQKRKQTVKKVPVWKDDHILLLNPYEILYFTIKDGSVTVVTSQGSYHSRDSLNLWEDRMKEQRFFRTHKSFLVNLDKVKQAVPFFNYTYLLKLEGNGEEIPVSRSYLKDFKQVMMLT
ncbi:MAG TPA: LytTR family DNA-binding domain-containing protein [Bacillota bacterium]|nr:LytTR family DNA-binding domain-containing protein [Bacillota bacterium]